MRTINKVVEPASGIVTRLDGVYMSDQDRRIAEAYLRKTEALLDLLWVTGAKIRATFARSPVNRRRAGNRLRQNGA